MSDLADMAREEIAPPKNNERRSFIVALLAIIVGGIVAVFPFIAGLGVIFDPLRRKRVQAEPVRVTTLDALPDDGLPRKFPILDTQVDAWSRYPTRAIGSVYLRRMPGENTVRAWTSTCPHYGCAIDFKGNAKQYQCPCHVSAFDLDGNRIFGPSPRAMDSLAVEVRGEGEVWVVYEKFRSDIPDKIPV